MTAAESAGGRGRPTFSWLDMEPSSAGNAVKGLCCVDGRRVLSFGKRLRVILSMGARPPIGTLDLGAGEFISQTEAYAKWMTRLGRERRRWAALFERLGTPTKALEFGGAMSANSYTVAVCVCEEHKEALSAVVACLTDFGPARIDEVFPDGFFQMTETWGPCYQKLLALHGATKAEKQLLTSGEVSDWCRRGDHSVCRARYRNESPCYCSCHTRRI